MTRSSCSNAALAQDHAIRDHRVKLKSSKINLVFSHIPGFSQLCAKEKKQQQLTCKLISLAAQQASAPRLRQSHAGIHDPLRGRCREKQRGSLREA
jgi:hypothetical protein